MFTYLWVGTTLILSDSYAQKSFLSTNLGIWALYEQDSVKELAIFLKFYLTDAELQPFHRENELNFARAMYNSDIEQHQFFYTQRSGIIQ